MDCDNPDCCPRPPIEEPTVTWPACLRRSEPRAEGPQFEPTVGQVVSDIWQAVAELVPHLRAEGLHLEANDMDNIESSLAGWLEWWHADYPEPTVCTLDAF
jgi:hypothetical protein